MPEAQLRFEAVEDRGLFSENYLWRLQEQPEFTGLDPSNMLAELSEVWLRERDGMPAANESRRAACDGRS